MLKKIFFLTIVLSGVLLHADGARVVQIRKTALTNPTVFLKSGNSAQELNGQIERFLYICGWFDRSSNADEANYLLETGGTATDLQLRLYQQKQLVASWRLSSRQSPRELAKIAVDTVIEKLFNQLTVKGFCRSRIAFTVETSQGIRNIYLCDIDGNNVTPITNYRTLLVEPSWTPGGKTLCFSKYNRSGIEILETTIAQPRRSRVLSAYPGINTGAAVSPDGQYLAAILSPKHRVELFVINLRTRAKRQLTSGIAVEASPCWSPKGGQLVFVSDESGVPRLYTIGIDGRNRVKLPAIGSDAVTPDWNDDDKIAYATKINGSYTIAVYDLKTGKNTVVSKGAGSWEAPGWAPDNRQVVCKRTLNGKSSLYVLDTITGKERMLLHTGNALFDPAWSPCLKR